MKIKVGISSKIQGLHFLVVGADELDAVGCGLNIRDAVMEKIFVLDSSETSSGGGESSGRNTEQGAGQSGSGSAEKEEGEVGEAGEDVSYRQAFWTGYFLSKPGTDRIPVSAFSNNPPHV